MAKAASLALFLTSLRPLPGVPYLTGRERWKKFSMTTVDRTGKGGGL